MLFNPVAPLPVPPLFNFLGLTSQRILMDWLFTNNKKGETYMDKDNRVLGRRGARDLNEQEVEQVSGGIRTLTLCTAGEKTPDGDTFL
ncbi:MAG TPA: hypothetical protein VH724_03710, partial [Candidatus Angelobacter sp.]|nr:hypothetical protein [Candidatus Angelobacter sp.]